MRKKTVTTNLLTKEGHEKIKEEIRYREEELRKELSTTLNDMRSQGDLRENDGYSLAVEANEQNKEEILRLKDLLRNSKVVKNVSKDKVNVGNKVKTICDGHGERTFTLVGEDHANPLEDRISYKSPIGAALMGKKVGDSIKLDTPNGEMSCKIKAIE